jgi:hypothetical protein
MDAKKIAVEMMYLAYRGSVPMGMGFLQFKQDSDVDREMIESMLVDDGKTWSISADYLKGRMVKLYIFGHEGDEDINPVILEREIRGDYQSWQVRFGTTKRLHQQAVNNIEARRKHAAEAEGS